MTEQEQALRELLTDNVVAYHAAYARIGGSVAAGILLAQLLYWTRYSEDGWVFRTQEQLECETALTEYEQNGARAKLKERGLIIEERRGIPCRLYYQPQFEAIYAALGTLAQVPMAARGNETVGTRVPETQELESEKVRNWSLEKSGTIHESDYKNNHEGEKDGSPDVGTSGDASGANAPIPPKGNPRKPKKPPTPLPPAVIVFRETVNRYPPKSWYQPLDEAIGAEPRQLDLWRRVVHAWIGSGYNPINVKAMLECYKRGEIPGTSKNNGAGNGGTAAFGTTPNGKAVRVYE